MNPIKNPNTFEWKKLQEKSPPLVTAHWIDIPKAKSRGKNLSKKEECVSKFGCSSPSEPEKTAKLKIRKVYLKHMLVMMGKVDSLGYLPNTFKFTLNGGLYYFIESALCNMFPLPFCTNLNLFPQLQLWNFFALKQILEPPNSSVPKCLCYIKHQ